MLAAGIIFGLWMGYPLAFVLLAGLDRVACGGAAQRLTVKDAIWLLMWPISLTVTLLALAMQRAGD